MRNMGDYYSTPHLPIMIEEVISALNIKPDGIYNQIKKKTPRKEKTNKRTQKREQKTKRKHCSWQTRKARKEAREH